MNFPIGQFITRENLDVKYAYAMWSKIEIIGGYLRVACKQTNDNVCS